MAKKKTQDNPGIIHHIIKYALIIPAICGLIQSLALMAKDEAVATKKRLVTLAFLVIVALLLFVNLWVGCNILWVLFLMSQQLTFTVALIITMSINLFLLLIVCLILALTKIDIFLPETRQFIRDLLSIE